MTEDRKAFEEWVRDRDASTMRAKNNRYIDAATDHYWMAWQAATARERERCARIAEESADESNRRYEAKAGGEDGMDRNAARYRTALNISAAIRGYQGIDGGNTDDR